MKVETIGNPRTEVDVVITTVLDKRYAKKDGTYNVSIQVYHERKYLYHRTKISVRSIKDITSEMYDRIDKEFDYVRKNVKNLYEDDEFSLLALNKILKAPKTNTLNDAMRNKINEFKANDKISTAGHYECALRKFEKYYGEVTFEKVNAALFEDFKSKLEKEGLRSATQMIYFSDFKTVIKRAIYCKLMKRSRYPFREDNEDILKCEMPSGSVKRQDCYFTLDEMGKIFNYYENATLLSKKWISLFLFSYLSGGINFADMCRLKYTDAYFKSGCQELAYVRKKTEEKTKKKRNDEKVIRIPLFDYTKELIKTANLAQRNTAEPKIGDYVFPFLNDKMNEFEKKRAIQTAGAYIGSQIKTVAKKLGIEKEHAPSMTYARHSFGTNMRNIKIDGRPIDSAYVEYQLGHSLKGAGDHYFAGYDIQIMVEYNSALLNASKSTVEAA